MAEKTEMKFTDEQAELFLTAERLVLSAISASCAGCSTARLAPGKYAEAVVKGDFPRDGVIEIATRLAACPGFFNKMCHYSSAPR